MSRLFESFEFLDRGWDVRVLESSSIRSMFLMLLGLLFVLGALSGLEVYALFHHTHQQSLSMALIFLTNGMLAFRYARVIYRRLGR